MKQNSPEFQKEIERLKLAIDIVFDNVQYPGYGEFDCDHCACTCVGTDPEISAFREFTDWRSIPDSIIEFNNSALSFFSARGYQFYLPRFLIYVLEHYDSAEIVIDSTLYSLDPLGSDLEDRDSYLTKYDRLSLEQKTVIFEFLQFIRRYLVDEFFDEATVESALEYWRAAITR